ncbi:unnamed protein product, partial [Adineta ricciae]
MANNSVHERILHICQLLKENKLDGAAELLASITAGETLLLPESIPSWIIIEQTACQLLQNSLHDSVENGQRSLKFIKQIGLFNYQLALIYTDDVQQTRLHNQVLFDPKVIRILVEIVNTLLQNDNLHHHDFILILCKWLEAIGHFVHRHDNLSTETLQSLRQSVLSCVLSDWYKTYLKLSVEINIPARMFFIRTCSFLTGIFQCAQLSFENALKTAQSYQIVLPVGEQIFDKNLSDFRQYLSQKNNIENDSACLTGVCLLITNCYKHEAFRDDHEYFSILLSLLKSNFVRTGLLPSWTNDSTILADTLMVQLKNATLVHNHTIQINIAASNSYFDYLISISDEYNIIYDILWTLSFNNVFHSKFCVYEAFLKRLKAFADQPKQFPDADVAQAAEGILWNITDRNRVIALPNQRDDVKPKEKPPVSVNSQYDLMLSYCWTEKTICKKIFQQLISKGFRVWFDEKDMHGRSCSAMAHAIENSQCIVICMSENYENSNACHHEAEYAYVRQCRMVPLVVQSKYKARK